MKTQSGSPTRRFHRWYCTMSRKQVAVFMIVEKNSADRYVHLDMYLEKM